VLRAIDGPVVSLRSLSEVHFFGSEASDRTEGGGEVGCYVGRGFMASGRRAGSLGSSAAAAAKEEAAGDIHQLFYSYSRPLLRLSLHQWPTALDVSGQRVAGAQSGSWLY
jgi:hypothetical protein